MTVWRGFLAAAAAAVLFLAAPATAREYTQKTDKVTVTLYTNFNQINPNQNLEVLIKFAMHDGWHIFAQNPAISASRPGLNGSCPRGMRKKKPPGAWKKSLKPKASFNTVMAKPLIIRRRLCQRAMCSARHGCGQIFPGWPAGKNVCRKK